MLPESIQSPVAVLAGAALLLLFLYIAARLVVAGGARSWFETAKRWKNKHKEDDDDNDTKFA